MNTELFADLPETPSPKLAWLRKHNLKTWFTDHMEEGEMPWACCKREDADKGDIHPDNCGIGYDEDEAILSYCHVARLTHYSLPQ